MKRSKMVEIIANQLDGTNQYSDNLVVAERILTTVENIGMLPPMSMTWVQYGDQVSYENATAWEPEE